jgi:hypothetical protein
VSRSGSTYYRCGFYPCRQRYILGRAERRLKGERDSLRSLGSSQLAAPAHLRAVSTAVPTARSQ